MSLSRALAVPSTLKSRQTHSHSTFFLSILLVSSLSCKISSAKANFQFGLSRHLRSPKIINKTVAIISSIGSHSKITYIRCLCSSLLCESQICKYRISLSRRLVLVSSISKNCFCSFHWIRIWTSWFVWVCCFFCLYIGLASLGFCGLSRTEYHFFVNFNSNSESSSHLVLFWASLNSNPISFGHFLS